MIALLTGRLIEESEDSVILDVHGVGYELCCSTNTLAEISGQERTQLKVYTHVREDALVLFGFSSLIEKQLFLSLIKVNGVGPKMAITILSATRLELLIEMIENGDVKGLTGLPKVGKKKAEQIILSLKGKLVMDDVGVGAVTGSFKARKEIVSALVNLGFKLGEVEEVVDGFDPGIELQDGIRKGLSALTNHF